MSDRPGALAGAYNLPYKSLRASRQCIEAGRVQAD